MDDREIELKARELALAERELVLKEREAAAKIKLENRGLMFSSPLLIAIVSTIFGTAIGAGLQGYSDGRLERLKFEFALVESAFENSERDEAAKQLRFIASSGVIRNLDTAKLRNLADTPDEIPRISSDTFLRAFYEHRLALENPPSEKIIAIALPEGTIGIVKPNDEKTNLRGIEEGDQLSLLAVIFSDDGSVLYDASSEEKSTRIQISADIVETDVDIDAFRPISISEPDLPTTTPR